MIKRLFYIGGFLFTTALCGQATFSSGGTYTQDFGTSNVASWTDNVTYTGWYAISWNVTSANTNTYNANTVNITAAAPPNVGAWYTYTCNGGNDVKLGTRPSNGTGSANNPVIDGRLGIGLGVCIMNNLGSTINSLTVSFDWYQLSLAQNVNVVNTNFFDYFVSPSNLVATDLPTNAHPYTNVPALSFTAPNNDPGPGTSSQLVGYPCTVGGSNSACIAVTIPAGSYIMLRWWDPNNSANDPHMAIDNISVTAYSDNICTTILPIELTSFTAQPDDAGRVTLNWTTASENDNHYFTVERADENGNFQPVTTVQGSGTTLIVHDYSAIDAHPFNGVNYYRLRQTDYNGASTVSGIIPVTINSNNSSFSAHVSACEAGICYAVSGWDKPVNMNVYDMTGRLVFSKQLQSDDSGNFSPINVDFGELLLVVFASEDHTCVKKIIR